jgi:hypothetical protein
VRYRVCGVCGVCGVHGGVLWASRAIISVPGEYVAATACVCACVCVRACAAGLQQLCHPWPARTRRLAATSRSRETTHTAHSRSTSWPVLRHPTQS